MASDDDDNQSSGSKASDWIGAVKGGLGGLTKLGILPTMAGGSFKKGGKVKHTEFAKVHKGERVLTKKQAKSYGKAHGLKK